MTQARASADKPSKSASDATSARVFRGYNGLPLINRQRTAHVEVPDGKKGNQPDAGRAPDPSDRAPARPPSKTPRLRRLPVSLRMSTSLGFEASNIDLYLTPQGVHSGNKEPLPRTRETWVATHSLRAYTDQAISFDVSRDYVDERGDATICVSGYIVS